MASLTVLLASCGEEGDGSENPTPSPTNPTHPNTPTPTPQRPAVLPPSTVDCGKGSASVSGRFLAPNGTTPVADGFVYIVSADCWVGTDKDGNFTASGLPASATQVRGEKGPYKGEVSTTPGGTVSLKLDASKVKLGYVAGDYDSIELVLERLGFTAEEVPAEKLNEGGLSDYTVLFLNCGMLESYAEGDAPGNLRTYVQGGGLLYASDFTEAYVRNAFPAKVAFNPEVRVGTPAALEATVVNEPLKRVLGDELALINFDDDGWAVMDEAPAGTQVLVRGPVPALNESQPPVRPYAVQFQEGQGRVTYTSFHNEAQSTPDMDVLLEQMLLNL